MRGARGWSCIRRPGTLICLTYFKFRFVKLPVTDLVRSAGWYRDVLDLRAHSLSSQGRTVRCEVCSSWTRPVNLLSPCPAGSTVRISRGRPASMARHFGWIVTGVPRRDTEAASTRPEPSLTTTSNDLNPGSTRRWVDRTPSATNRPAGSGG